MGLITSVRRAVTETSLTSSDLGKIGSIRVEPNGKIYKLVQTVAGISADGLMCVAAAGGSGLVIVSSAGASASGIGMNTTGGSLAASTYFWMQIAGEASGTSSAAYSAGASLGCAASGKLATFVPGTGNAVVAIALEAATAGSQRKLVLLRCM